MKRLSVFILIVFLVFIVLGIGFCQEDLGEKTVKKAEGTVARIDEVASILTVTVFENNITFLVTDNTKITRGEEEIDINDIEINDSLLIEYYDSELPPYEAKYIIDNNLANE